MQKKLAINFFLNISQKFDQKINKKILDHSKVIPNMTQKSTFKLIPI